MSTPESLLWWTDSNAITPSRDPWWLFTNAVLLYIIAKTYGSNIFQLISSCPRLGILLLAICLAVVFTIMDILASTLGDKLSTVDGINPYWKLSLVFKCLTDAIMLDDFQTELGRLSVARLQRERAQQWGSIASTAVANPVLPGWNIEPADAIRRGNIGAPKGSAIYDH